MALGGAAAAAVWFAGMYFGGSTGPKMDEKQTQFGYSYAQDTTAPRWAKIVAPATGLAVATGSIVALRRR